MADKYCTLKNCLMLGIHVLHTFNISENDKILLFRHTYLVCTLVITDLYHIHALFSSYYSLLSPVQYLHVDSPMESNDSNRKVMQALTTASVLRNY